MNLNIHEASLYAHKLSELVDVRRSVEVVIAPTTLALQTVALQIDFRQFKLAAQNLYWRDSGAFTGEVSANQLRGLVKYAIIGHSERRHVFHERERDIRNKVQAAVRNRLVPVLCIGETAGERALGETDDVIHDQLASGLTNVTSEEVKEIVIAYEPVWAIGTGDNAMPHDVESAVKTIRAQVRHLFGTEAGKAIRILYGGSVAKDNAMSYLRLKGVDGLLIGGASLDAKGFAAIANDAYQLTVTEKG